MEWRVINAAEYGEVQRRRRVFIFASRRGNNGYEKSLGGSGLREIVDKNGFFTSAFPIKDAFTGGKESEFVIDGPEYPDLISVSNRFAETFYRAGCMKEGNVYTRDYSSAWVPEEGGASKTLRSILIENVDEKYFVDNESDIERWKFMKGPKKLVRKKRGTDFEYLYSEGGIPFPDVLDSPSRTILTSEGSMNRSSHFILDPAAGRYRILTPTECE